MTPLAATHSVTLQAMNTQRKSTGLLLSLFFITALLLGACDRDDKDERNKFLGRYEVEEQSLETYSPRDDYEVRIRKEAGTDDLVIISNFYNYDVDVLARVEGHTLLVFPQTHNVFEFEGTGTLSGQIIIMNYTVTGAQEASDYFDRLRAEMTLVD